jgi:hypothetical protein
MTKTALTRFPRNDPSPGFVGEINQVVAFGEHLMFCESADQFNHALTEFAQQCER